MFGNVWFTLMEGVSRGASVSFPPPYRTEEFRLLSSMTGSELNDGGKKTFYSINAVITGTNVFCICFTTLLSGVFVETETRP